MSPRLKTPVLCAGSFPRVSGDEPSVAEQNAAIAEFSPRERG